MKFVSNRFAHNMTLVSLLATSLGLATLVLSLLVFDSISSQRLLQNRLSTLADIVGQNSTAALNFNDKQAAGEVLHALEAEPPIVFACLYDVQGHLFASYERDAAQHNCRRESTFAVPSDNRHRSILRPVLRRQESVGVLLLTSDLQDVNKRRRNLIRIALALVCLMLVIGGIAATVLQRRITHSISGLVRAMQHVRREHNFAARVEVAGSNEIAQLGNCFNTMLSELELRDKEKRAAEARLQYQALNDELTGLPNRRLLADRLSQTLAIARRESRIVALLYIDLDGFKLVNDSLGHAVGDILLIQVSDRLRSRIRQSDTLARIGGDEFTAVLGSLRDKEDAALVAKTLLGVLAEPFFIDDHEISISASIGISMFPDDATDSSSLLQEADSAMYTAKRYGKNRMMYFTAEIGCSVRERLNLENQLRGAITRGEITVQYQPEFNVSSGELVRFEALARWTHPTLGVIPPDKFIPIAEESGLIVPLGAYIMEVACGEAVRWQAVAGRAIQVAVNVSSMQFSRDSFVEEVIEILKRTELDPKLLQIELTESVMLKGAERSAEHMKRLNGLGVTLAIDDFGTGYSCLSYLPRLPFSALKIDRSFVHDLETRPEIRAMVRSLVALAENMGMNVIVEGVEKKAQLELIRKIGGDEIQGYLMGRPTADPLSYLKVSKVGKSTTSETIQSALK